MTFANLVRSAALSAALCTCCGAHAALVYDFGGLSKAPSETVANTTATHLLLSGVYGSICAGVGGNPGGTCGLYGNGAATFTLTPEVGYGLNITGFSFDELNTGDIGPTSFSVFTSADGFATAVLSGSLVSDALAWGSHAVPLALFGLGDPFQVRIVASGHPNGGTASPWNLDNVRLDATAAPLNDVPEPSSIVLVALSAALMTATGRRKTRQ
ncbi:PEP-CTERM sorting domain-containing protein [Niveibacterium sp. SC-1]|uniref:PEP-CTERM sorting domain-containing protein n=1 Tax=Niveibacterium sp. SC-1 TaxID=3135646 RepID=UPI00311EDF96